MATTYGKHEFMVCGGGSVLARVGGFDTDAACVSAARAALAVTPGADYATRRIALSDAPWTTVEPECICSKRIPEGGPCPAHGRQRR